MAIPRPPAPSLPKEAPWKEVEAIILGLQGVAARLDSLLVVWGASPVLIPGAPGAPGGPGGAGLNVKDLQKVMSLWNQPAAESGLASGGSTLTLRDDSKNWVVDQWAGNYVRVVKSDGTVYYGVISSNTNAVLTFSPAFGAGIQKGDTYGVRSDPKALVNLWPTVDIWSAEVAQVQLTAVAGDITLPSVTIAGIPTGATIHRAVMFLKFRNVENINALVNSVSGAQNIQAQNAVGGTWTTGIALPTGVISVPASTREGGDVLLGTGDLSGQIPANGGIVSFKWALALALLASLNLNDVQVGIRCWYSV